ncbi:hypothetical protein CANARDRAFT_9765 [[Candida] arabinofermentans NRRL YB-2248]|uniref:RING-type domain-containing protein n=1 Tax=[Candida] arabinofermentans NRRL YB-2248 TaxID=983967 RepID=A0A1E4SUM2_9ASCO|nr:hypothetical protein CANARDRAFT_9765 [[Candida] arabinofermentans NRRL YB-2248]
MKFAKLFQQVLEEENVPVEWAEKAIQYKALKKRINKVVEEFESVGLKKEEMTFTYEIEKVQHRLYPQLSLKASPVMEDRILKKLKDMDYSYTIKPLRKDIIIEISSFDDNKSLISADNPFDDTLYYEITIDLHEDTKFFQTLYEELEELSEFKSQREKEIISNVEKLASLISKVGSPNVKKSDMYAWREIFQLYIETEIFFSTSERSTGNTSIEQSKARLVNFLNSVEKNSLRKRFKNKGSAEAFTEFKAMNMEILKVSSFQTINNMAVYKILKKFDKQTRLNSKEIFPDIITKSDEINILNSSIAKNICYIVAQRILNIIPQIDDYTCPICCSVAFKPIRLDCGHLFCVRCLVKLQRKDEDRCPLCRQEVVVEADERNLDTAQMAYLKLYFPKEVKAKQTENEREIFKETYGAAYNNGANACILM